jgi:thiol-disulfide isomerase/thioredoxin
MNWRARLPWLLILLLPLVSVSAALLVAVLTEPRLLPTAVPTARPTVTHALLGQTAPNFELTDLDGKPVRLSSLRGRTVFVNFWATWCDPCRREFPAFEAFSSQHDRAVILAVNQGETVEPIRAFLASLGVSRVPVLLDSDMSVSSAYAVEYFPSTFVIDPAGVVVDFHLGEMTLADLEQSVRETGTATP